MKPFGMEVYTKMKKTVVFDFDGVIHSYTSGWKGEDVIPDPPVTGIKDSIHQIRKAGYEVVVVSTRCASEKGMEAVKKYLADNEIAVDRVCKEKPPAIVYIDDRAICFDGKSDKLLEKIEQFKPWYQRCTEKMTAQKAIDFIENEVQIDIRFCSEEKVDKTKEVFKLAKVALAKQIPQKPILQETKCFDGSTDDFVFVCPVCNRTICIEPEDDVIAAYVKEEHPHCNCGQALDWG